MSAFKFILTTAILTLNFFPCFGCKCGQVSINHEVEKAYDFVIGRIREEKEHFEEFTSNSGERTYDWNTSYSYFLNVEYSFKDKLKGQIEFFGGKGYGDCGGIFEKGKSYLIVIYKGSKGYFTKLCSDHSPIVKAGWQINYLNQTLGDKYQFLKIEHVSLLYMTIVLAIYLVLLIVKLSDYRTTRKKIGRLRPGKNIEDVPLFANIFFATV